MATGGDGARGGSGQGGTAGDAGSGQGGTAGDAGSGQGGTAGDAGSGQGGTGGDGQGGASGAAGVGGAVAGTGNASGNGGAGGNNGGTGGSFGGSAGANTSGAECDSDDDCQLVSDCCNCQSMPKGEPVFACGIVCVVTACEALQIESDEVACRFGRCVFDRSCDSKEVTCETVTPACEEGTIPSVLGTCWGPCLPPTECSEVTSCADCADSVCVENETQLPTTGCVVPDQGCSGGSYCQCLGACMAGFSLCSEDQSGVTCSCPNCI
jgi:hypothetical protein